MLKHCLIVFGVSMVPLIELRGAIPYGVAFDLPLWLTFVIAIIGNMLPGAHHLFLRQKVLGLGQRQRKSSAGFSPGVWKKAKKKKGRQKAAGKSRRGLFWALLLFVGIPLPGTGAWTGTLAASLLDMDFKKSVLACMGGVLLAGIIMGLASAGLLGALSGLFAV